MMRMLAVNKLCSLYTYIKYCFVLDDLRLFAPGCTTVCPSDAVNAQQ